VKVHCSATNVAISNERMPAPNSQLRVISVRSVVLARGSADECFTDGPFKSLISINDTLNIVFRQVDSITSSDMGCFSKAGLGRLVK